MRRLALLSRLVASLACAWPLGATATLIVPVSQTRTVSAYVVDDRGAPSSFSSYSAPDFANIIKSASAGYGDPTFNPDGSSQCCWWTSGLRQISRIEDNYLYTRSEGALYYTETVRNSAQGSARSVFDVVFDLTTESNYIVSGIDQTAWVNTDFSVTLSDDLGTIITGGIGTLAPGRYRFQAILDVPLQLITQPSPLDVEGGYLGEAGIYFTAVPEPSTASLLALGVTLLGLRRRA